jgi:hypothetical protein
MLVQRESETVDLIDANEAAQLIADATTQAVYALARRGLLPAVKVGTTRRGVRFRRADVVAFARRFQPDRVHEINNM